MLVYGVLESFTTFVNDDRAFVDSDAELFYEL